MKIGIDIRTLMDKQYSGVSEYVFNLIKEILKLDRKNEYQLFYNCYGACHNIPEFKAKNVKLIKYNYPNKVLNYLYFKFFNYPKIDQKLGVDIFFMPHINFIGLSAGARSLITIHDLSFLRRPELFSARKNFWHKMINVKKLVSRFDAIAAVSENTKRDIIELCGADENKIKVIYAGVGAEYRIMANDQNEIIPPTLKIPSIVPAPSNSLIKGEKNINAEKLSAVRKKYNLPEKFIFYLGTIEPRKNVDGIIRAYNQLRIGHYDLSNVKLVMVGGRGWKSKSIYQERMRSEFKDDIKFLGYIDPEDKVYFYNLASVFIYPSFYEGFGFPPLEAMACGLAVITSYASSLPEVAGNAALMINPYNINDMALGLAKVLTDSNLRNKLIERGLEQAKKFSWRKTAVEYLKILESL